MTDVAALLDKAKRHCSPPNYSGLATRIEVSRAVVSEWKNGTQPMPEERVVQVARIAGENAGEWLLRVRAEQTQGEVARAWHSLARKLGAAAAVACVVVALPHFAHENQQFFAGISAFLMPLNIGPFIHYANLAAVAAALILLVFSCRNGRFRGLREVAPAVLG